MKNNSYSQDLFEHNNQNKNSKSGQTIRKPRVNDKNYGPNKGSTLFNNKPDDAYTLVTNHKEDEKHRKNKETALQNQQVVSSPKSVADNTMFSNKSQEQPRGRNRSAPGSSSFRGGKSRKTKKFTKKRNTRKSRRKG